jgi:hypothetical protein
VSSYLELFALATDSDFQKRIRFALWKAAFDIKNEADTVPDHTDRLRWAVAVLNNEQIDLGHVAIGVLLNPSIGNAGAAAPDSDIQFVVNGLVPELIG